MTPTDAFSHIAKRTILRVPIDALEGRITTSQITLRVLGEVFNSKIIEYLKFNREFACECPGFETDIHGLVQINGLDGTVAHFADCVAE